MEALECMLTRRSCRAFIDRMPDRMLIEKVCCAGTYAPTGRGKQSPLILAVTNRSVRDRLMTMNARIMGTDTDPFYGAPVVLVVLADSSVPTYSYDGPSVLCQLANAAHAAGLASCWIHRAKEEFESEEGKALLKELGVEGDYVGVGHIALGYPAKELPAAAPRKADYVRWVE